jgi:hypothetical protein
MTIVDAIGFLAAGLVFLTFWMKTLIALRLVGIGSNIAFAGYGVIADLMPIVVLHLLLLPLNLYRAWEQLRLRRRIETALSAPPQVETLLPHMRERPMAAGTPIFRKGDRADCLYFVASGLVEIPEFAAEIAPGQLFGEVGLFNREGRRVASAVMKRSGTLCMIERDTILRLCHTQPDIGLSLTRLLADRIAPAPGPVGAAPPVAGRDG